LKRLKIRRENPMRAQREQIDPVTREASTRAASGRRPGPGFRAAVKVRGRTVIVAVDPEQTDPGTESRRVSPDAEPEIVARAQRATKRPKRDRAQRSTFASAPAGAAEFLAHNQATMDAGEGYDSHDLLRDWMDGIEVGKGVRSRKLSITPAGKRILEAARRSGTRPIAMAIAYLFGQARGRRWAAVPWRLVDSLGVELERQLGMGWVWMPGIEADTDADRRESIARFADDLERLRKAIKRADLTMADRRMWHRRMRELDALAADPQRLMTGSELCEARVGEACSYPTIEAAIDGLEGASTRADDGIDLPWENPMPKHKDKAGREFAPPEHHIVSAQSETNARDMVQGRWGWEAPGWRYRSAHPSFPNDPWQYAYGGTRDTEADLIADLRASHEGDYEPWEIEELDDGMPKRRNPTAGVLPSRAMKQSPIRTLDGAELADLGTMIEVQIRGTVIRWKAGKVPALWFPESQALIWFEGGARYGRRQDARGIGGKAADARKRWSHRAPSQERTADVTTPRTWRTFGQADRVDYRSDKFDLVVREYTHETRATLYRSGGVKPPWIWVLKGPGFRLTTRGLIG
jgi:hypothetical protein